MQAGVDLGTVVKEYDDAVRTSKKGSSKAGGKRAGGSKQAAERQAELVAGGVQIRPKRRMPVSKVGGVPCRRAGQVELHCLFLFGVCMCTVDPDL